jgi:hypothetical protein
MQDAKTAAKTLCNYFAVQAKGEGPLAEKKRLKITKNKVTAACVLV